ncbi:MAG: hypothetical protein U1F83_06530 [Verrucomicrobiota bacterium]
MRPGLDEYVGQTHILAPGQLLRRAIEADRIQSLLFYGPPGTGKTLAQIIARQTKSKVPGASAAWNPTWPTCAACSPAPPIASPLRPVHHPVH